MTPYTNVGPPMTQGILKSILDGPLPMLFSRRTDIDHLQTLSNAGYLEVSFGALGNDNRNAATVMEVTPLGQAAIRYLGFEIGTNNGGPHQ